MLAGIWEKSSSCLSPWGVQGQSSKPQSETLPAGPAAATPKQTSHTSYELCSPTPRHKEDVSGEAGSQTFGKTLLWMIKSQRTPPVPVADHILLFAELLCWQASPKLPSFQPKSAAWPEHEQAPQPSSCDTAVTLATACTLCCLHQRKLHPGSSTTALL